MPRKYPYQLNDKRKNKVAKSPKNKTKLYR